ncbi:RteC domain-containing protein [Flavobacterium ardleyense]|uniref:RteC domain-containing protein n=1 Tax=Flavobacterium ardleyense TaxID=2038737 RepID=A0ABW5Z5E7_9FLAO
MKDFSTNLISNLEAQLSTIQWQNENTIKNAEQAVKLTINSLEELKTFFKKNEFKNKQEEIEFFKNVKPKLTSKLIYYNEIYNIEISKPAISKKAELKHYDRELAKLKTYFTDNLEFFKYYRSGNTALDKKYFLRRKHDIKLSLDSSYFQSDLNFTTSHDYKVAKIIANNELQKFIENKRANNQQPAHGHQVHAVDPTSLKWTGSKVALVELMYALHTEGVINNGNISLNETAKQLEILFNIEIGQFNRVFSEIKNRKSIHKTSFLNSLKENLIKRIDEADAK